MKIARYLVLLAALALATGCDTSVGEAPVAVIAIGGEPFAGQAVRVDASASHGAGELAFEWRTAPDAEPVATEAIATLTFHVPGEHRVWLTVRDHGGGIATAESSVVVRSDFVPPVAHAGDDIEVDAGAVVEFDAAGCADNVAIVSWAWDFDASDGPYFDDHAPRTEHAYPAAGLYRATITVFDAAGNEATDERVVRVRTAVDREPPTAVAGADRNVHLGATTLLDGSSSTDNVAVTRWSWQVDGAVLTATGPDESRIAARFAETGEYTAVLTTTDEAGNTDSDELIVRVIVDAEPPRVAISSGGSTPARTIVEFDASGSSDNTEIVDWRWEIDGVRVDGDSSRLRHSFTDEGPHRVDVTATDGAGLTSRAGTDVSVTQAVPVALIAGPDIVHLSPGEFVAPSVDFEFADLSRLEVAASATSVVGIERRGSTVGSAANALGWAVLVSGGRQTRVDVAVGPAMLAVSPSGELVAIYADGRVGEALALGGAVAAMDRAGNTVVVAVEQEGAYGLRGISLPDLTISDLGALPGQPDALVAASESELYALIGESLVWPDGRSVDLATLVDARLTPVALGPVVGELLPIAFAPRESLDVSAAPAILAFDRLALRPVDLDPTTAPIDLAPLGRSCRGAIELLDTGAELAAVCLGDGTHAAQVARVTARGLEVGRAFALAGEATDAVADPSTGEVVVVTTTGAWRANPDHGTAARIEGWGEHARLVAGSDDVCAALQHATECAHGTLAGLGADGFIALVEARWRRPGGWLDERDVVEAPAADAPFSDPRAIVGAPDGRGPLGANAEPDGVYTITNSGELTIHLGARALVDGPGPDLIVLENAFYRGGRFFSRWIEPATVEVSFDGIEWISFESTIDDRLYAIDGADPRAFAGFAGVEPVLALAGLFDQTGRGLGGDRFDLATTGLPEARHVRLRDLANDGYTPDIDAIALRNFAWR